MTVDEIKRYFSDRKLFADPGREVRDESYVEQNLCFLGR